MSLVLSCDENHCNTFIRLFLDSVMLEKEEEQLLWQECEEHHP